MRDFYCLPSCRLEYSLGGVIKYPARTRVLVERCIPPWFSSDGEFLDLDAYAFIQMGKAKDVGPGTIERLALLQRHWRSRLSKTDPCSE